VVYKIELPRLNITSFTKDVEKLKSTIMECFNSKTEIDVYDKEGEKVGSVWADNEWNYFYTL
tara:strand:- start:597 stop:782 length:186 start_codon:yes stop_codon:yes gene_type:complete